MPLEPHLDNPRLLEIMERRGLSALTVARTAGIAMRDPFNPDPDVLERQALRSLEDLRLAHLRATTLLTLAAVLQVTVEELLHDPPNDPLGHLLGGDERHRPAMDAEALHAALLMCGSLSRDTLMTAFDWPGQRLEAAAAQLRRLLHCTGAELHQYGNHLMVHARSMPAMTRAAHWLSRLPDEARQLHPEHAVFLCTAVRAHVAGPVPGPPMVAGPLVEVLKHQGAARPRELPSQPGRPEPLVPTPDLLFGLALTDWPAGDS